MRILMAGASGFLGTRLVERLRASGHDVTRLVRRPASEPDEITWEPSQGRLDPAVVAAADTVINLAGAGVGDHRWTPRYKSLLRSSRVDSTGTIARAIKQLPAADRPGTLLQASAVGWYGDTGDREVTEEEPAGRTFLADVCRVWEAAARPAEDAGTRVVPMRTGLVLDPGAGLLKPLLLPFKLGGGARIDAGRQWMPWIGLADWMDAAEFLLTHDEVAGPVNMVGPQPVTNAEFTKALGRAVHRPALLVVPSVVIRAALGEFGGEIRNSQRVLPSVLERAGFRFTYADIDSALRNALNREPSA
ncbi:TIGR01777 family oxidoreductase [Actinoplanes sp. NPDC051343]|uniref:TIGR01777 family oxidoreductase n=1 Tax=Actinoplanes sp. NPDC051343 TaxID=3363906 RepID=UPI0037A456CE